MKRYLPLILILFAAIGAFAQNISVADFRLREADMTAASLEGKRIDRNGQPAALIRIETTETGFVFEAGTLGIVDSKQETGEVWVWVPRASRKITIKHPQLGVLYDYRYPIEIEAERTYWMKLTTAKVETVVKERVHQQYLTFQLTPRNATLEVNDELWSVDDEGIATKYVEFGTYTYRVRAADHNPEAGSVTVDDPENSKIVPVILKSNLVEVTLTVPADAEIWVNNERKGIRTWTGGLGKGVYRIECRQTGHEAISVSKEITAEMNGQTITLVAPTPVYGSLNVESTPNMATIYIDGKEMGKTPKSINEILVGRHELRLIKNGYKNYIEAITITKGERKQVNANLDKNVEITQQIPVPEGAVNGVFSVSPTEKVYFSKGNLQYKASTQTWRFAEHQWDVIGKDNKKISYDNNEWIDLFGWGTGNAPIKHDIENETYRFVDWGKNPISNGGKTANMWRTMKMDEWVYLIRMRETSSGIRYAKAQVNGKNGLVLLPDDWDESIYALNETDNTKSKYSSNIIGQADWDKMERVGVVFLPAAGRRIQRYVEKLDVGNYWSNTVYNFQDAYYLWMGEKDVDPASSFRFCHGYSVRLVRDVR